MNGNLLIAFGFGWMVVAALIGLHLGARHEGHIEQLRSAAARGDLPEYHRMFEAFKWRGTVHAHGMLFALSSVCIGLVLSRAGPALPFTGALIGALIFATVAWTLAAMKRIRPVMALADLLFACVLLLTAAGVARLS